MIYHLLYPLHTTFSSFNVFRYITFRTIYATITALLICFILGPWMIRKLQSLQIGQPIREDGPNSHLSKEGTPTMGGVLIIFATVISTFLWANLTVNYIWMILMVTIGFGLIGLMDDFRKLGWEVQVATEDGSAGKKGLVTHILDAWLKKNLCGRTPEFFACGPNGLLAEIKRTGMPADRSRSSGFHLLREL